jgi:carbon-monoxide dehydrogenase large subunit
MGGIAQGVGEALTERLVYDESGQLLTASLLDYAVPNAAAVPDAVLAHIETPSPRNPLGIKGAGEAGVLGAVPAIVNAVADALAPLGVREVHPPLTSERVWRWMREAGITSTA